MSTCSRYSDDERPHQSRSPSQQRNALLSLDQGPPNNLVLEKTVLWAHGSYRLVAGPAIAVLASRTDLSVTIASNDLASASSLASPHANVNAVLLELGAENRNSLRKLVKEADVVLRSAACY